MTLRSPIHRFAFVLWALLLLIAALGRLHGLASLSPPDLAFFHQSCWSASQGLGFQQTGLEFDHGSLLGSMHLSLVRALWMPVYWLAPRVETLVGLQGLAVGAGGWAAVRLARVEEDPPSPVVMAVVLLCPLFPLLATVDLRPLVFILPGTLWTMVGLREKRLPIVVGGALLTLCAREEACYVLGALIPWALWEHRSRTGRLQVGALGLIAIAGGLAAELWWPGADNIRTTADPGAVIQSIRAGDRPVLQWEQEWQFGLVLLLGTLPALRKPLLFGPGLVAWLYLAIFSDFEPMAPGNGGLHYLSVIAPFWLGALALGTRDLQGRGWLSGVRAQLVVGAALLCAAPQWIQCIQWSGALFQRPTTGPRAMISELRSHDGGVLADPQVAPLLSGRALLRIQGHFQVSPERAREVAEEVDWALLPRAAPPGEAGRLEWSLWNEALPAAGLEILRDEEGWTLWSRAR